MSDKKWTHQTCQKIAESLGSLGTQVSATTVRRLLRDIDYSLRSNKKCLSAGNSPDRDTQFRIIDQLRKQFSEAGDPIISVDTKKKELIGLFKNSGRVWCEAAKKVKDHDFRSEAIGIAAPYGIFDTERNFGMVVVGQSADTPQFAVNCIVTWWKTYGQHHYPGAKRLLILADSGGSNGSRPRAWKKFLQERLADQCGLEVTIAHYPTGASKWNPIEHRMFSEISKNWAGEPLESFEVLVNFAKNTRTTPGLQIDACIDQNDYEKGVKVPDKEMEKLAIVKRDTLGKWNYTIKPRVAVNNHSDPDPEAVLPALQTERPGCTGQTRTAVKM